MKRLIIDLDGTICKTFNGNYSDAVPTKGILELLAKYKKDGFAIVISTSRNMLTYQNNIGKINANTLPIIIEWLNKYQIPFDEIFVGKPWCGDEGFYVDDKAIRPSEFLKYSYKEIVEILDLEK